MEKLWLSSSWLIKVIKSTAGIGSFCSILFLLNFSK
ncbi:hypothetical protein VCC_001717 [Vibrio cholerae RC9]|nr:hypothetical protein VCC_001717 [Vibrio cholerae RC9]EEO17562.1 hypothetical protein VCE_001579 [Vibrio cholerae B33]